MKPTDEIAKLAFRNFNVRFTGESDEAHRWAETHNRTLKVFTNFDGGGFNFYICEFLNLADAEQFLLAFPCHTDDKIWAEDTEGKIHDI